MGEFFLTFEGDRRKRATKKGKWQELKAKLALSDVKNVFMFDNSDTCQCGECEEYLNYYGSGTCRFEEGEEGWDAPCWDYESGGMWPKEDLSFIEVHTEEYIYRLYQHRLWGNKIKQKTLAALFDEITHADHDVNVEDTEKRIEEELEELLENNAYRRKLGQKKTCNKCKAYKDRSCLIGYKMKDGVPLEPCTKPDTVRQIEVDKEVKERLEQEGE